MKRLHIDSIRKYYHDKLVLSDVFLSCELGEVVGIIGRNGCGKSTLLKIIFGIESAENKYIRLDKKILKNTGDSRSHLNYLPQGNFLPAHLKVYSIINLFLPKHLRQLVLEDEFIQSILKRKYHQLSGGEKRILEITLLLFSEAEFVLLDEPFEGISPVIKDRIIERIADIKKKKGFILTDHDYENVLKVADRIFFLQHGHLKEIRDKKDLFRHGYLTKTAFESRNNDRKL